jgi:Family of unknown function (DUF6492)
MADSPDSRAPTVALVTPTYRGDLARCELLVESARRCCPTIEHRLVIDRRDLGHFRHLQDRATIVVSEQLLPRFTWRVPGARSIWVTPTSRPTRGWIVQQVLKLAAASMADADVSVFCDSDVTFVRPFTASDVVDEHSSVGLLDVDFVNDEVRHWTGVASSLLGLAPELAAPRGHVGNLIAWRRENVVALTQHIAKVTGHDWRTALMRLPTFSEYVLYGVFVRGVLGYPGSGHHPSIVPLVKASWGQDLHGDRALDRFLTELDPQTVAVMIHSKDQVSVERYRATVERCWSDVS